MLLKVTWEWSHGERRRLTKSLLIMKFIAILLFATGLQVSATGYSQTITLAQNNVSLKKVFREIEKQSGYQFFYRDRLIRQAGTVSIREIPAARSHQMHHQTPRRIIQEAGKLCAPL